MQFTPINEDEYAHRGLWPRGWYAATIPTGEEDVIEGISKNGNPFFKVNIHVFNETGSFRNVATYIMAGGKAQWQLRAAAEAFGVLENYKSGTLDAEDLRGRSGFVKIDIEEGDERYGPKNVVRNYSAAPPKSSGLPQPLTARQDAAPVTAGAIIDDEVPF